MAWFLDSINPDVKVDHLAPEVDGVMASRKGLTFATVEAAQGLEWPVVWAVGVSDHILPGEVPAWDVRRMRNAQRRFLIWSTRARDRLFYCHAILSGPTQDARPSGFLEPMGNWLEHEVVSSQDLRRRSRQYTG